MNWEFTIADLVGWLLALTAGGWSIYTWRKGNQTARLQTQMQQRLTEIEEAREKDRLRQKTKAELTIRIESGTKRAAGVVDPYSKVPKLAIQNHGAAEARNIEILLDDRPFREHPYFPKGTTELHHLGGYGRFDYPLKVTYGSDPPSRASVRWADDSGEPGKYETDVSIYQQ